MANNSIWGLVFQAEPQVSIQYPEPLPKNKVAQDQYFLPQTTITHPRVTPLHSALQIPRRNNT